MTILKLTPLTFNFNFTNSIAIVESDEFIIKWKLSFLKVYLSADHFHKPSFTPFLPKFNGFFLQLSKYNYHHNFNEEYLYVKIKKFV
jgi:hypothetical protein